MKFIGLRQVLESTKSMNSRSNTNSVRSVYHYNLDTAAVIQIPYGMCITLGWYLQ
jgi:hypothetical protein